MFYILYPFIWLVTWLPLRVLYVFSDIFYLIVYHIIPYRKKLVHANLKNSFPEKTDDEISKIEKKFYRFFCDTFIETLYILHMSEAEMKRRFDVGNIQMIKDYYAQGKSVMIMTAHYGNWEWGSSFSLGLPTESPVYNIYKRLSNKAFGELMNDLRGRFGGRSVEMKELLRKMVNLRSEGKLVSFAMISDQRPRKRAIHYWTRFLNQDAPVFVGTEQLAKKFDYPVIYIHINRVKRGYYHCEYFPIADEPLKTGEFEITEKYIRILEQKIKEEPAYWLWTHKRWNHKKS